MMDHEITLIEGNEIRTDLVVVPDEEGNLRPATDRNRFRTDFGNILNASTASAGLKPHIKD